MKNHIFLFVVMTIVFAVASGCATGAGVQVNTPVPNPHTGTPAPSGDINVPGVSININAPSPDPLFNTPGPNRKVAGILMGIWHGIISPVTIVLSFVNKDSQMYEVHNDGGPYNLGFVLGVVVLFIILGLLIGFRR
jgi:hypothetical protein